MSAHEPVGPAVLR